MLESYRKASCLSVLFHFFQLKLLCKVFRENYLNPQDLFLLPPQEDTRHLVAKLNA